MIIIHGANGSPFVRKVKVALAEKSVPYQQEPLIPFGVSDEYRAKSPLGKIPCLEDGDFVLPDSSCIIAYLEKKYPSPALMPSDPEQYGRALWYEEYGDSKLIEVIAPVFFERFIKKMLMQQEADEARVQATLELQPPVFDYLEGEVADREYLAGGQFSVADIAIASPFVNLQLGGVDLDASRWPRLADYVQRVFSRPSFKGCIAEEMPGS